MKNKFDNNLKLLLLLLLTYYWKILFIDIVIKLSISTNFKDENYNFIIVIIDLLTKIVYYKLVKITININLSFFMQYFLLKTLLSFFYLAFFIK